MKLGLCVLATALCGCEVDHVIGQKRLVADAGGWSTPGRSATSVSYYVSSSAGSDANDGKSESTPLATLKAGTDKLRSGDWLLLKRGDTFHEAIFNWPNGTAEGPTVYAAYGDLSLPRPIVEGSGDTAFILSAQPPAPPSLEHLALLSLHLRQTLQGANWPAAGVFVVGPGKDLLFEDLLIEGYGVGLYVEGRGGTLSDIRVRRTVIVDSRLNEATGLAVGMLAANVAGLLVEESIFDHNGYTFTAPAYPRITNHSLAVGENCSEVVVRSNLLLNGSSHGIITGPGLIENNVIVGHAIGAATLSSATVTTPQVLRGNVIAHPALFRLGANGIDAPRGWGLVVGGSAAPSPVEVSNNLLLHGGAGASVTIDVPAAFSAFTQLKDNLIYDWGTVSDSGSFVDASRTVMSYQASMGQPATLEAFYQAARTQRRGQWNEKLTAAAVRAYFVEGFTRR
jgi:hypothetical protein